MALLAGIPALAESYPPEAVEHFMGDCTEKFQTKAPPGFGTQGNRFCTCMINGIQEKMSFAEFQQLGDEPNNPTLQPIEQGCMRQMFSL